MNTAILELVRFLNRNQDADKELERQQALQKSSYDQQLRLREQEDAYKKNEMFNSLVARNLAAGMDLNTARSEASTQYAQMTTSRGLAESAGYENDILKAGGARPLAGEEGRTTALANIGRSKYAADLAGEGSKKIAARDPYINDEAVSEMLSGITGNLAQHGANLNTIDTNKVMAPFAPTEAAWRSAANAAKFQTEAAKSQGELPNAARAAELAQTHGAVTAQEGIEQAIRQGEIERAIPRSTAIDLQKTRMLGGALAPYGVLLQADPYGFLGQNLSKDQELRNGLLNVVRNALPTTAIQPPPPPARTPIKGTLPLNINMIKK